MGRTAFVYTLSKKLWFILVKNWHFGFEKKKNNLKEKLIPHHNAS
jgi:hypothetical protein